MNGFVFAALVLSGLAMGWVIGATAVVRNNAPVAVSKGEVIGETASMSLYKFYDREEGVVCYSTSRGLSCLRLVKTP